MGVVDVKVVSDAAIAILRIKKNVRMLMRNIQVFSFQKVARPFASKKVEKCDTQNAACHRNFLSIILYTKIHSVYSKSSIYLRHLSNRKKKKKNDFIHSCLVRFTYGITKETKNKNSLIHV